MSKIATEQEAYNIGGKGTPIAKKCVTNARAYALGCKKLSVANNKLIEVSALIRDLINLGNAYFSGSYISNAGFRATTTGSIELINVDAPEDLEFRVFTQHSYIDVKVSKGQRKGSNSKFDRNYSGPSYDEEAINASILTEGYSCIFTK